MYPSSQNFILNLKCHLSDCLCVWPTTVYFFFLLSQRNKMLSLTVVDIVDPNNECSDEGKIL